MGHAALYCYVGHAGPACVEEAGPVLSMRALRCAYGRCVEHTNPALAHGPRTEDKDLL